MATQLEVQEGARTQRENGQDNSAAGKLRDWEVDELGTIHALPSPSEDVWKPEPVNLEDELFGQQQQEFEEQQQIERMQALQAAEEEKQNSPINQVKDAAKDYAKSAVKTAAKEAVREGAAAAGSAIIASAPVWGPIVGVIALIGLLIALVVMTITSVKAVCDGGYSSADMIMAKAAVAWIPGDVCAQLAATNQTFSGGQSGGGGGGASFDEQANRNLLLQYGIQVNKDCIDPTREIADPPGQTCVGGMRPATIQEIISLAQACDASVRGATDAPGNRCGVVVTGGAEPGHELGTCSHGSGNKGDIRTTPGVNSYILNPTNFTQIQNRGSDNAPQYRNNSTQVIYARESNHWDIGGVGCT